MASSISHNSAAAPSPTSLTGSSAAVTSNTTLARLDMASTSLSGSTSSTPTSPTTMSPTARSPGPSPPSPTSPSSSNNNRRSHPQPTTFFGTPIESISPQLPIKSLPSPPSSTNTTSSSTLPRHSRCHFRSQDVMEHCEHRRAGRDVWVCDGTRADVDFSGHGHGQGRRALADKENVVEPARRSVPDKSAVRKPRKRALSMSVANLTVRAPAPGEEDDGASVGATSPIGDGQVYTSKALEGAGAGAGSATQPRFGLRLGKARPAVLRRTTSESSFSLGSSTFTTPLTGSPAFRAVDWQALPGLSPIPGSALASRG